MDVVVRDLATGAERVRYAGGGYVVESVVSHDQRSTAVVTLSLQPNSTVVSVVGAEAEGEGMRPVTGPDEHARHQQASWTADDTALVLASNHDRDVAAVVRVPVAGGAWDTLVEDPEHDLEVVASPDGAALLVGTVGDGAWRLAVHEADGAYRCAVDIPEGVPVVRWSPDGRRLVVSLSTPTEPGSLYLVDAATGAATVVVDAREDILEPLRRRLVTPTSHLVPTPDGEEVPCFVYPGVDDNPELVGSVVVHIHGGPEGAALRTFMPVIQALAVCGFTVLAPNVRGSEGYGKRWYSLDDVAKRLDSVADLAALHAWLPTQGLDPARAALWGGSYGGYMVLAGVTMQPDLWSAGVDIVGISSLVTFLENTSGYRRAYREREYGRLDRDRDLLEAASPLTYLDALRAPLFVIHGANDPRVPLSEAEQIKAALDARGVECVLKVYADEGHGLAKRANRLDAYPAAIAFLDNALRQRD